MKNVLVAFVSGQNIPAYMFIKQMYNPGDEIMLITSKGKMEMGLANLKDTLAWEKAEIKDVILQKAGDEDNWQELIEQLAPLFDKDKHYIVNITGGTKMMNIALYHILTNGGYDAEFNYKALNSNDICWLDDKGKTIQIEQDVTIQEFCSLYGHELVQRTNQKLRSLEEADRMFSIFTSRNDPRAKHIEAFELLREWRKKGKEHIIDDIIIGNLLQAIEFKTEKPGYISKYEIDYITGGWFEEWTYYQIKSHFSLDDEHIVLNAHLDKRQWSNELDVAFMYKNALHIIECKSGIEKASLFNDILDKANAIKNIFGALSTKSILYGLSSDEKLWNDGAQYKGIIYMSKEKILNPDTRFDFIK